MLALSRDCLCRRGRDALSRCRCSSLGALAAKAVGQQSSLAAVPGLRGTIFDRNGQPLAQDQPAATVIADQPLVKDKQSTAIAIAEALGYRYPKPIRAPKVEPGKKLKKRVKAFLVRTNAHRAKLRKAYTHRAQAIVAATDRKRPLRNRPAARQISPAVAKTIMHQHLPGISTSRKGGGAYPGWHDRLPAARLHRHRRQTAGQRRGSRAQLNPVLGARSGEQATVHGPERRARDGHRASRPTTAATSR